MAISFENPNHLLIGLGGTGGKILKEFKKHLYKEFPNNAWRQIKPAICFLYVDSTREMMNDSHTDKTWRVYGEDVTFTEAEFFNIRPQASGLSQILDNIEQYPGLRHIVKNGTFMRNTLGEIREAAGQKRRAGRILFASNCTGFMAAVANKYEELKQRTKTDLLHIHIFTGLAGGTGSGAIIDAVCQIRKKYPSAEIDVYAMVPELSIPSGFQAGRYHQNGYAALRELSALNVCKFLPSDVLTGAEHISFRDQDSLKQFGLILYSNVNENGVVVDSIHELPSLVANIVFFRIFLNNNPNTQDLQRAWSCENLDQYQVEYNTRTKGEQRERARTKAISTFGMKRILYPEYRIREHISYFVSLRAIYQMQHNNFQEEGEGYVDERVRKDYSEFMRNEGNMRTWKLDEKHLTLQEKILDTDKQTIDFLTFWRTKTELVGDYSFAKQNYTGPSPLGYLEAFFNDQFSSSFRLRQGVETYYHNKAADVVLKEQASTIVEAIERHLYTQWVGGNYSMDDLIGISDAILNYVKSKLACSDDEIVKIDEKIDLFNRIIDEDNMEFNSMNFIQRTTGKPKQIYNTHKENLIKLYVLRTEKVAKLYSAKLLLRLRILFEEFCKELNDFISKLAISQEQLIAAISERTRKGSSLDDLTKDVVEVIENDKVYRFEQILSSNRSRMDVIAKIIRDQITGGRAYARFSDLASQISDDFFTTVAETHINSQVSAFHEQDEYYSHDRIIGISILQQLKKFKDKGLIDLSVFARDILTQCGVYLKLSGQELQKTLNNNPSPQVEPQSINRTSILISMPKEEGDDGLVAFAAELKEAFKGALGNDISSTPIKFDNTSERNNEITIVQVRSCFPVRALEWLPAYKSEYDALIQSNNEATRRENQVLLHSEGDGSSLPLLEGEGDGPKGDELIPYLFIAAALGKLKWTHDNKGYDGWCFISIDEFGGECSLNLANKFVKVIESENLTMQIKNEIFDVVDDCVKSDLLRTERDSLAQSIKSLMSDTVRLECGDTSSSLYRRYADAARAAMGMVQKQ